MVDYFNILYTSGRSATASLLLALTVMVSPTLIRSAGEVNQNGNFVHVLSLIMLIDARSCQFEGR